MKKQNNLNLKTPVLFLIFNRLDTTKKVFKEIRKAKPKQLFIAADGPRKKDEKKKTDEVRKYVLDNIDWDCEVKKLFRKENFGCKKQTISAIDWFFENVEQGIILEDDALPSQSLFIFHQKLLEKYKNEDKVKAICGINFLGEWDTKYSYLFSEIFFSSWGFATWRRAWRIDESQINEALDKKERISPYLLQNIVLKKKLKDVVKGSSEGWDYLFGANNMLEKGLTIVPARNLVKSMGLEGNSTHEVNKIDRKFLGIERSEINFPLKHPQKISASKKFDRSIIFRNFRKILLKRLFSATKIYS